MVTWQLSTEVKRQEREANLSYQRDANMQKDWRTNYTIILSTSSWHVTGQTSLPIFGQSAERAEPGKR